MQYCRAFWMMLDQLLAGDKNRLFLRWSIKHPKHLKFVGYRSVAIQSKTLISCQ